jgi:hypothetical protein
MLRLLLRRAAAGAWAVVAMIGIECFQLTGIAAGMLGSEWWVVRIGARLLGTHFGWLDLVAYGVGIGCIWMADRPAREEASPTDGHRSVILH